jgi:hypothetical protein
MSTRDLRAKKKGESHQNGNRGKSSKKSFNSRPTLAYQPPICNPISFIISSSINFVMADDQPPDVADAISPKYRAATLGRSHADKRRARSNLPTWSEVNAMYSNQLQGDSETSEEPGMNKRWTLSVSSSSDPLFSSTERMLITFLVSMNI